MNLFAPMRAQEDEREADGRLRGLLVGTVTDNQDPEGLARVRVHLAWQEEGNDSFWARLAMPMAGGERGTYFLPEVGDEVVLAAEQGNPEHLIVLGSLWNGRAVPPATNDGNNDQRLIRSRAGHELMMFDGADSYVDLKREDGKHIRFDGDGIVVEDGQGNLFRIESSASGITIESGGTIKIKSQSISIEAGASLELKASGTLTIQGAIVQIN